MSTLKELLASRSPESRQRIQEMAEEMLFATRLYELREALNISQRELAGNLGISQPSVAAIEQRGNELKISTLKRYVEAMGGTLRLDVELPDGKHLGFRV
ncbi:helix-turn-helix transcriptional regulator [Serratia ficaria]|uniref:helix-turn-helix domain-containing protein n=1 Tax=Serratia TaxID=613 RepID=UPI001013C9D6|nr:MULTISPECIES: helix-turn-helix transcriptional regulator [Serratia]MEE4482623.1 helix-turn-helix transcriptional regulator [Serratia ficaria]CAI0711111.1 Antitoxin HigA [Serratia entomophila]CAI0956846.1 Antitoxin HigA [Serratia ficaria]CAI1636479.1 Antitoxin HigA [Serratia entomophila]CAI1647059.1 Antitoxin HigA [Serratia entomophila]